MITSPLFAWFFCGSSYFSILMLEFGFDSLTFYLSGIFSWASTKLEFELQVTAVLL